MAWLALGNAVWRRRWSAGYVLRRPTLGREIGGDLAKILLCKAFCYWRHDRVVTIAAPVVVQLLDEVALLLASNDRNGFRVSRQAVLAVACDTHLHFGFDVVGCKGRPRHPGQAKPSSENREKVTRNHRYITSRPTAQLGDQYSNKTQPAQRPARNGRRPDRKIKVEITGTRLVHPRNRSHDSKCVGCRQNRPRSQGVERQAIQNFIREKAMRSKLMLILTASVAVMISHLSTQTIWAQGQAA